MFRLKEIVENVFSIIPIEQGILIVKKKDDKCTLVLNGKNVGGVTLERVNPIFGVFENSLYYSEFDGDSYRVNLETGAVTLVANRYMSFTKFDDEGKDCVITTRENGVHAEVIDLQSAKTLLTLPDLISINTFTKEYFFACPFRKWDRISCYNRKTWEYLWQFDVSVAHEWINSDKKKVSGGIVNILGYWEGLLLLHVTRDKVVALDHLGQVAWVIDNILEKAMEKYLAYGTMFDVRSALKWQFARKNGLLYLTFAHFIFEIDLRTRQKRLLQDFTIQPEGEQWWMMWSNLHDNRILFTGATSVAGAANYVAIYDVAANKIVWSYNLHAETRYPGPDASLIEGPRHKGFFMGEALLHQDKLYAKDDEDRLYVFEQ
jgi:hypothetical protein